MATEDEILKVVEAAIIAEAGSLAATSGDYKDGARLGARALAAHLAAGAEPVSEPLYKRVEAILDKHSAWIARPNDEVTKRIALAAMFAAHSVLMEEEAPEDRYLRDGAREFATPPAPAVKALERIAAIRRGDADDNTTTASNRLNAAVDIASSALAEDAGAADLGAGRELEVDGFGALPVLEPAPAPASDDLADRLDAPTPFYGWKDPENYTPVMIPPGPLRTEASARIRSDAATIASLRDEVEQLTDEARHQLRMRRKHYARAEAAEAERDALKAGVARKGGTNPPEAAYGIIDPDYARIFTIARCVAWSEGYAVLMHGSFTRDLDLVAVPWTERACDPEHLVKRIAAAVDGVDILTKTRDHGSQATQKPHGRMAWTLIFTKFGDPRFVDLSVMPRVVLAPIPAREG